MAHGDFVWCDLSARNVEDARRFYTRLLGWDYESAAAPDGSEYLIAHSIRPIAGLFAMPKKFDDMGMPCFWMSYIEVKSLHSTLSIASDLGGKVELGPLDGFGGSRVALVRDPLGAGFTLIEGQGLQPRLDKPKHGDMAWNELYVSNARAVIPFYQSLFDWEIKPATGVENQFDVTINGGVRSTIYEMPDSVRGKAQFWGVQFAINDLDVARSYVRDKGQVIYDKDSVILARDSDGAAFFLSAAARFG